MRKHGIAWIRRDILAEMVTEADRRWPHETGGVLMGYWVDRWHELVVTECIGPGPRATHGRRSFEPDYEYQHGEIARVYNASGRLHTYLGDWHTHPDGGTTLSHKDQRTLRSLATDPGARASAPIMAILAGGANWRLALYLLRPSALPLPLRLKTRRLKIEPYTRS